jgi:ferric-dicitrate binding protein FerR (iron transport regulator)
MTFLEQTINYFYNKSKKEAKNIYQNILENDSDRDKYIVISKTMNRLKSDSFDDKYINNDLLKIQTQILNKKKSKKRIGIFYRVASVILLCIVIGSVFIYFNNVESVEQVPQISYLNYKTLKGQTLDIRLMDGTRITLKENTHIRVPSNFSKQNRNLILKNGEAYFRVYHNKKSKFKITTKKYNINVLGTSFNVRAYRNEGIQTTFLNNGKVQIEVPETKSTYNMIPGQKIIMDKKTNSIKLKSYSPSVQLMLDRDLISFSNMTLDQIVKNLELLFNKEIEYVAKSKNEEHISCSFRGRDLDRILESLKKMYKFELKQKTKKTTN